MNVELTEEQQAKLVEYRGGCSCHISPPCANCSMPVTAAEVVALCLKSKPRMTPTTEELEAADALWTVGDAMGELSSHKETTREGKARSRGFIIAQFTRCAELQAKIKELEEWNERIRRTSATLTCVYCGKEYPPGSPTHGSVVLTEHIKICEKHPLRAAEKRIAELESALKDVGR